MERDFVKVDALTSVRKIQDMALEKGYKYFPVLEDGRIIGVVTYRELLRSHINRIAADAMSNNFMCISPDMAIWRAKEILARGSVEVLFVRDKGELLGIVFQQLLDVELGKHTDLLTGLYKNDYIYYNTMELINSGKEVSIIFIDVNNFGQIDKEYGHVVGDAVLKEISAVLKRNIPDNSFLCRFGGDEFLILAPFHANICEALVQKLIIALTSHRFPDGIHVSISAGIASAAIHDKEKKNIGEVVSRLINNASLASTKAKKFENGINITGFDMKIDAIS